MIWVIFYLALGYWAAEKTIYRNTTFIEFKIGSVFIQKVTMGAILGWILIPIAIIKVLLGR